MAYRDDIAALEARHAALSAEVRERERARDEAALLVAEAHAKIADEARLRDALAGGLTRRPRARVLVATTIATAALGIVIAVFAWMHHRSSRMDRMLDQFSSFVDKECACSDAACSRRVVDEITAWAAANVDVSDQSRPSDHEMKRATAIAQRFSECVARFYSSASND